MAIIQYLSVIFVSICNLSICDLCTINSTFVSKPGFCMCLSKAQKVQVAQGLSQRMNTRSLTVCTSALASNCQAHMLSSTSVLQEHCLVLEGNLNSGKGLGLRNHYFTVNIAQEEVSAYAYLFNSLFPGPGPQNRTVSEEELYCTTNAIYQQQTFSRFSKFYFFEKH